MRTEPVVLVHGWGGSFAHHLAGTGLGGAPPGRRAHRHRRRSPRPRHRAQAARARGLRRPHHPRSSRRSRPTARSMPSGSRWAPRRCSNWPARHPERFGRIVVGGIGANLFRDDADGRRRIVAAVRGQVTDTDVRSQLFAQYAGQPGNDPVALAAVLRAASRAQRARPPSAGRRQLPGAGRAWATTTSPARPTRWSEALPDARLVVLKNTDHFATPESFALHRRRPRVPGRRAGVTAPGDEVATGGRGAPGRRARRLPDRDRLRARAPMPRNEAAVRRIFAVKGRPADHPVIVHLAERRAARRLGRATVPPARARLAAACWPGPLTLLVGPIAARARRGHRRPRRPSGCGCPTSPWPSPCSAPSAAASPHRRPTASAG